MRRWGERAHNDRRTSAEALHLYVCRHVLVDEYSGEAIHQASDYTPDSEVVDFANDYVRGDVELLSRLIAEEVQPLRCR